MSGFPEFMKKITTRAIIILLVSLLGINACGLFLPKASADTGPDLIVQDITLFPENPAIGNTVTITVTIKNQGDSNAAGSYVTCYVDSSILETKNIGAINSGIMDTVTFTWQATQGTHTIRAIADASGIITEADETNNENTYTLTTLAPDLTIQSISWSPANPSGGDSVVFSIVVKNQGNIQSQTTSLNFFIDGNTRGTQDIAAINPGVTSTKTYTWTMLTGEHTLRAVVDEADNNKESDETNNELTVTLATGSLDLAFQDVVWSPQNPSKYDTVSCNVTVVNLGQGRADLWHLAYFIDGNFESTIQGSSLESGASVNITLSWETLEDEHDIRIVLDYYGQINETDESNNEYNVSITTLIPDLLVSDISWLPINPGGGDTVTITVKIKNQGSGRAAASRAAGYIDNRIITYLEIPEINAGEEATATFTWVAVSGTHSIRINADYDWILNENNRNNNYTIVQITIIPPDLIISNITWSPENPALDETVNFTITITNQGSGVALNFHIAYFMDDALLTSELITSLDAGASANRTYKWKAQNGRHTFKAIVNYNNYIIESDKTNNENSIIFAPNLPDLAINSIIWSPADMPIGDNILFDIDIENQGLVNAAPSRIAFYIDGNAAGYVDIGRLEPGVSTLQHFTWASSEGFHSITITLDSTDQIIEIDEVNNTRIINIPLPDLTVEDITFSPPGVNIGDTLVITTSIKNQGNSRTEISRINCYVNGIKIATEELLSVDTGETVTKVFNWTAEAGIHTFKITVDVDNTVIEVNETNNEQEIEYATATPDLLVEGMSWTTNGQVNSNEATFTISVKNNGTGPSGESQVKYTFDSSPPEYKNLASIEAGETASFSFIAILSSGEHTITIIADCDELIEELDEDNNQNIITFSTITPDLVIRTITYTPLDATVGDTITITIKLENRGTAKAENVRLALSIDGSIVDYTDIPEMEITTPVTVDFIWTAIEGEHEISVFADSTQVIAENNEQNNTKSRTVSFATSDSSPTVSAGIPISTNDGGGLVEKWWWLLLLLAGLLIATAFVSTLRLIRKR